MAIQIPNPGTGNGATGDNEFVLWTKVKDNFSDQTNAASKLVGTAAGQIPLSEQTMKAAFSPSGVVMDTTTSVIPAVGGYGVIRYSSLTSGPYGTSRATVIEIPTINTVGSNLQIAVPWASSQGEKDVHIRYKDSSVTQPTAWGKVYTTANTKLDTNGAIAPSSPTVDLYSDRIETNSDGEKMNPEFVRNGVGDYTIKNTTGLRDEGWYIKIPNDMNGNPKVAVAIDTDKDGNLSIKTYKRTFSLETFTFGPDLNEPLDIPEGRWIDLRFNDLPLDDLGDTQAEV